LKENGQIYIFNSDNRWFPSQEGLVGFPLSCPTPKNFSVPLPPAPPLFFFFFSFSTPFRPSTPPLAFSFSFLFLW
ncbi:uncharacterized protein P174DRAFT_362276, partial [Aspergillus novofumigatus IBT 16806]